MATVSEVLKPEVLDGVMQQLAPADVHSEELIQFKIFLQKADAKQLRGLTEDLKTAARVRGRKILLREKLLSRLGTEWLRKQQEIVEGEMANIEVAKDTLDFNILELELAKSSWKLGKLADVKRLSELAGVDPLINMIVHHEQDDEQEIMQFNSGLDDEGLENMFGDK